MFNVCNTYNSRLPRGYRMYIEHSWRNVLIITERHQVIIDTHVYTPEGLDEVITKANQHWKARCANGRNPYGLPHYEPFDCAPYLFQRGGKQDLESGVVVLK